MTLSVTFQIDNSTAFLYMIIGQ